MSVKSARLLVALPGPARRDPVLVAGLTPRRVLAPDVGDPAEVARELLVLVAGGVLLRLHRLLPETRHDVPLEGVVDEETPRVVAHVRLVELGDRAFGLRQHTWVSNSVIWKVSRSCRVLATAN